VRNPATRQPGTRDQATAENTGLHQRVTELEDDLATARTSLRRMIREKNSGRAGCRPGRSR